MGFWFRAGLFLADKVDQAKYVLDNAKYAVEDLNEINRYHAREVGKSVQELCELFTDGFVEMIVKNNPDWESSEEIENRINEMLSKAKDSYARASSAAKKDAKATVDKLAALGKRKLRIQQRTMSKWLSNAQGRGLSAPSSEFYVDKEVFNVMELDSLEVLQKRSLDVQQAPFEGWASDILATIGAGLAVGFTPIALTKPINALLAHSQRGVLPKAPGVFKFDPTRIHRAKEYLAEVESYVLNVKVYEEGVNEARLMFEAIRRRTDELGKVLMNLEELLVDAIDDLSGGKVQSDEKLLLERAYVLAATINEVSSIRVVNEQGFPDDTSEQRFSEIKALVGWVRSH